jgi:hypothetical protein
MAMAGISLMFTVLARILNKEIKLVHVPMVTWSLMAFMFVVAVTALLRRPTS